MAMPESAQTMCADSMVVTFWGVRGSFPCASPLHMRYGGNTSCVSVEAGGEFIIFDAGTGLWPLGRAMLERGLGRASLLLSHSHNDHIMGFPFFAPAWKQDFALQVMAGHLSDQGGVHAIFENLMRDPVFPVTLANMGGKTRFVDFQLGDNFTLGPVQVKTTKLNHPNGACGYRLEFAGKSVCYVTDTEHTPDQPNPRILDLIAESDLFIYDSTYTDAMFASRKGWGHSTWEEGIRLSRAAGVKRYAVFHHDPEHTDLVMDRIAAQVQAAWSPAFVAREGLTVTL